MRKFIVAHRKALFGIFFFLLVVPNIFVSASVHRSRGGDFRGYLVAGERFIHSEFLYTDSRVATNVTWPPFFAMAIVPFALLARASLRFSQVAWYLVNISLYLLTISIWCRLLWNRPCSWFSQKKPLSIFDPLVAVPLIFAAGPLLENFVFLQIMPLLLFLLSMALLSEKRGNDWAAGAWVGFAIAIKAFPVLLVPYYLYRRKFAALFSMGVTAAVLTLLPEARYGWHEYLHTMLAWWQLSFSGGYPLTSLNQSAYAFIGRWVASDPFVIMRVRIPAPPLDAPGAIAAMWLFRGLFAAIAIGFAALCHFRKIRSIPVEGAFWITTVMLFSPVSWCLYWTLLLPAYFVLYNAHYSNPDKRLRFIIWGSFALITIMPTLDRAVPIVRAFDRCVLSNYTLGAFLVLAGLVCLVLKKPLVQKSSMPA